MQLFLCLVHKLWDNYQGLRDVYAKGWSLLNEVQCCCLIRVSHKSDTQHKLRPLDWSRKCESCPLTATVYFQILNSFHSNSQPRWHLYLWTTINYITGLLCVPNTDSDCHQTWIWDMVLFGNGVMHFMLWFNVVHKFPRSNIIEWKREYI